MAELDAARQVFRERVAEYGGRIVDTAGDSVLAAFETAAGAVDAAVAVQRQLARAGPLDPSRMRLRIGVDAQLVVPTVARVLGHPMAQKETALASLVQVLRDQRLLHETVRAEHARAPQAREDKWQQER